MYKYMFQKGPKQFHFSRNSARRYQENIYANIAITLVWEHGVVFLLWSWMTV